MTDDLFNTPANEIYPEWRSMPEFDQPKEEAHRTLIIRCENAEFEQKLIDFIQSVAPQTITPKTKSIWLPALVRGKNAKKRWVNDRHTMNRYPIFIVSKGRWEARMTVKALGRLGLPYRIVVEALEYSNYAAVIPPENILVLPQRYKDEYQTCDDFGLSRSTGPGPARNFCWDLATKEGHKRHWVLDDNIDDFHRLTNNAKSPVRDGATFAAAEDFVDRYSNVPLAGMNYYGFAKTTDAVPPYVLNTRIYSCLLIENAAPYRWRGRYNEDTDLSLRVLKDGYCTVQFNAFLCGKETTQRHKGGNTEEFYAKEGTLPKSKMIEDLHPDVAEVVWKFNRWHHVVDYSQFKANKLQLVGDPAPEGANNYGMRLIDGVEGK
jgi:hypothetical protein